eukprot:CAMPEP_0183301774 /NCGR_PEP_ID=MMETSP0160_2-20130417/7787_1 /TAXON_ID=2839 ORGANISM="Odontella Sinensis, Strain Grunow 1884" /NCGR_SAMPLE_ID=MMETSP0160_2 /ASSEMBLY_ACC=CAM_ASM_000250 /LENGTH=198 /DNA_ID=CAMNT_0025464453 /DNA_START=27 /DNA_END=623 /DNA_ORIENTATION=-
MKALNPFKDMSVLGLGKKDDIMKSAALFEDCVEEYLRTVGVAFLTEKVQRKRSKGPLMPTPDFLLEETAHLTFEQSGRPALQPTTRDDNRGRKKSAIPGQEVRTIGPVNWVEAKMFYGASSIPQGENSAVGNLMKTANKYVKLYGPGAMVFSFGCGGELARKLGALGVAALDAHPLELKRMEQHQRTWCGDKEGRILP